MTKNLNLNAAETAARLGAYVAPETKVVDFVSEGVLCSSGLTEQFEDDYFDWN